MKGLGWQVGMAVDDEVVFFQLNGLILSLYPHAALARDAGVVGSGQVDYRQGRTAGRFQEQGVAR